MTQTEETQEEYDGPAADDPRFDVDAVMAQAAEDDAAGEPLPPLPEPMAADVAWPDVEDTDDMPIAAGFADALANLTRQHDEACERIETLYRTGIREIRELYRG